jgi:phage tail protein X
MDILRTHPVAIIGGVLHANPYFAQPKEFLREILGRSEEECRPYRS